MITDVHLHLLQLSEKERDWKDFFNKNSYMAIVSCHSERDLEFAEKFKDKVAVSFGVHPQNPLLENLSLLEKLIFEKRVAAIGEAGFDRYTKEFKEDFERQVKVFEAQLYLALKHKLPMVIHLRKGYGEMFKYSSFLSELPSVVFHSFSGTFAEAEFFVKRGVNCFFSFGTALINNHKKAINSVKELPFERILAETDAPYQPISGNEFSSLSDIVEVTKKIGEIKGKSFLEAKSLIASNFLKIMF
ncbi:MAG: TatD family hydrolase [bacterium]